MGGRLRSASSATTIPIYLRKPFPVEGRATRTTEEFDDQTKNDTEEVSKYEVILGAKWCFIPLKALLETVPFAS